MSENHPACDIPSENFQRASTEEWPLLLLVTVILHVAIQQLHFLFMERLQSRESARVETINTTQTIHGNDNINISTGSQSTIVITTTRPPNPTDDYPTGKSDSVADQQTLQHVKEDATFFPVVPKPVCKSPRLNTKTQATCRRYIDNLAQLSAEGKIIKCCRTIERLRKVKTDPDSQVSLRHAAALNAINEGNFTRANRLLGEAEILLPDTTNEAEHRLRWYHQKSLVKLQQGKHAAGIQLTEEALPFVSLIAPGCISAWLLINHAWFLTKIAADEDDVNDRHRLVKKARTFYQLAIHHAENEYPSQMSYFQLRVPHYAKIGLAFLYLGCWQSANNTGLGISTDPPWDDIRKAKDVIVEVQNEGPVCNKSKILLMVAQACLQYRLGSYKGAYDLAEEARKAASKHRFQNLVQFASSISMYMSTIC